MAEDAAEFNDVNQYIRQAAVLEDMLSEVSLPEETTETGVCSEHYCFCCDMVKHIYCLSEQRTDCLCVYVNKFKLPRTFPQTGQNVCTESPLFTGFISGLHKKGSAIPK